MNLRLAGLEAHFALRAQNSDDVEAVERLIGAAFGPGRWAKTGERLREIARPACDHSGIAHAHDDEIVGVCRIWHLRADGADILFLGPLAVHESHRGFGIGAALVSWCVARSADLPILAIGDIGFFARWGFQRAAGLVCDVPVRAERLLWRPGTATHAVSGRISAPLGATPTSTG